MRKQEIILFLYRVPNCPTEAEKIDFAKIYKLNIDFRGQKRNQIQQGTK